MKFVSFLSKHGTLWGATEESMREQAKAYPSKRSGTVFAEDMLLQCDSAIHYSNVP